LGLRARNVSEIAIVRSVLNFVGMSILGHSFYVVTHLNHDMSPGPSVLVLALGKVSL